MISRSTGTRLVLTELVMDLVSSLRKGEAMQ